MQATNRHLRRWLPRSSWTALLSLLRTHWDDERWGALIPIPWRSGLDGVSSHQVHGEGTPPKIGELLTMLPLMSLAFCIDFALSNDCQRLPGNLFRCDEYAEAVD